MKMWRRMFSPEHLDDDSKELADGGLLAYKFNSNSRFVALWANQLPPSLMPHFRFSFNTDFTILPNSLSFFRLST